MQKRLSTPGKKRLVFGSDDKSLYKLNVSRKSNGKLAMDTSGCGKPSLLLDQSKEGTVRKNWTSNEFMRFGNRSFQIGPR